MAYESILMVFDCVLEVQGFIQSFLDMTSPDQIE
jgi:hypothetical protein